MGLLLIFSMSLILAANCQTTPKTYLGNVYYKGNPLTGDYEIRAMMGTKVVGIGIVNSQYYSIDVYPGCYTGTISFYINGVQTNETSIYSLSSDLSQQQLDLTLNQIPVQTGSVCGNGVLNLGEECDENNFGTAKCNNGGYLFCNSNCIIDYTNCASASQIQQNSVISTENNNTTTNQTISTQNNGGGITGGAIGVLGGNNLYYLIGAIIIVVIAIAIIAGRRKKKGKEEPLEITIE